MCDLDLTLSSLEEIRKDEQRGKTIPSTDPTDLLIASIALHCDLILLHADNHFRTDSRICLLKKKKLHKIT